MCTASRPAGACSPAARPPGSGPCRTISRHRPGPRPPPAARGSACPTVDSETFLVGIFGHVTYFKKIRQAVDAFSALHARIPRARLVIVGTPADNDPGLARLLAHPPAGVQVTGRVAFDRLQELMAAVDAAINLRLETAGETSGTCIRLLGLGRPIIVTDAGWFSEIPDDACLKVRDDAWEASTLRAFLLALAERPGLRAAIGRNAARWIAREHSISRSLAAYETAFAEAVAVAGRHPRRPCRPWRRMRRGISTRAWRPPSARQSSISASRRTASRTTRAARMDALDREWLDDIARRGLEIGLG